MKKNTVSDGFRGIKLIGGLFVLTAFFAPHPGYAQTTPSVTVTADDLGDLDAGDQGTASASVTINNPPQPSKEGSIDTTYSWSIDAVSGGQVTVDNVNAPTTTVHAEFDDPGDYYYEVTCTVTCHDNNNNQDYGPYTDSDWVGDPDDAGATQSSSTPVRASASAAPQASGKQKRPSHVVLHFSAINPFGVPTSNDSINYGHHTHYLLELVLKNNKPFTKGMVQEQFQDGQHNHKYFSFAGSPQTYPEVQITGVGNPAPPVSHSDGFVNDTNSATSNVDTSAAPYKSVYKKPVFWQ